MSRILVFLQSFNGYARGEICTVKEDDHVFSDAEGLPKFGVINSPEITTVEAADYANQWMPVIDLSIVGQDLSIDGFRVDAVAANPGAALEGGITQAKAQTYLSKWGATIVTSGANLVRFDLTVQDAYKSTGFWGADPVAAGVVITETQYVQGQGLHRATIDISASNLTISETSMRVDDAGGTVTAINGNVLSVEFTRTWVRAYFLAQLKHKLQERETARKRFFFLEADVQTLEANGGEMTLTQAQVLARLQDKSI